MEKRERVSSLLFICIMKYYSAIEKKEILLFLTTWMALYVEPKSQIHKNRIEWWLLGTAGKGKWGTVSQRVPTSSYKMNKFWGI